MMGIYEIDINTIKSLDEKDVPRVIRYLLLSEGVAPNDFSVCSNTKDSDGGVDAIIQKTTKEPLESFIPSTQTVFQLKATEMSPKQCAAEINSPAHNFLRDKLVQGYDFVIVSSKNNISEEKKENRKQLMQAELNKIGASLTKPVFLDAADLQSWINQHQNVVFQLMPDLLHKFISVNAKNFNDWNNIAGTNSFKVDAKLEQLVSDIKNRILQNSVSHISGLAGIGKTRTVLEACNRMSDEDKLRIIYIPKAEELQSLLQFIRTLDLKESRILIIDECDKDYLEPIKYELTNSNTTLVTIDYDSYDNSNELKFNKLSNEVIEAIVQQNAPELDHNVHLAITRVADGFPRFAIDVAEKFKAALSRGDEIQFGCFNDRDIYKLLLRDRTNTYDQSKIDILMVLSLFSKIGCMPGMKRLGPNERYRGKYLADPNEINEIMDIFGLDKDKVFEVYNEFCSRGIIQQRGLSISVQPFPLAVHLAQQWKTRIHPDNVIKYYDRLPFPLQERFMEKVKYLENARDFAESFIGDKTSPFSNAELLNSPSNELFGQLAEIAPDLAMKSLEYAFEDWTDEDMRDKLSEHRRRIVWTLEKIMFHKDLYEKAAALLFKLAKGENETIGNNATGVLVQTMQVFLAPTEASLEQRINWLRSLIPEFKQGKNIILKMIDKGLDNSGHYSCMAGAESQGARTLTYYKPKTWSEVGTYFDALGNILLEINNTADDELKKDLLKIIGNKTNPLLMNGLFEKYEPLVSSLLEKFPDYIPNFIANSRFNTDKGFEKLIEYRDRLLAKADRDLESLFELYIVPSEWDVAYFMETEDKLDFKHAHSLMKQKSEEIADAYLANPEHLYDSLPFFISKNAGNINDFASRIGSCITDYKEFVNRLMALHMAMDNDNYSLLAVAMHEIWKRDPSYIDGILTRILGDERWIAKNGIIRLIWVVHGGFLDPDVDSILDLIAQKKISLLQLQIGGLSINLRKYVDLERVISFLWGVYYTFGTDSCRFIVETLDYYQHSGNVLSEDCKKVVFDILAKTENILFIFKDPMSGHHVSNIIHKIDWNPEEALTIFDAFKTAAASDTYRGLQYNNYASKIIKNLIKKHPTVMLPHVLNAMAKEDSIWLSGWMGLLGDGFNGKYGASPYVFSMHLDQQIPEYLQSVDKNMQKNIRNCIMEIVSLLNNSCEQVDWSPIIKYFIDTAETKDELNIISSRINNYTWWGNTSDYYRQYVPLFQNLHEHPNPLVRMWAKDSLDWLNECIKQEVAKEEELGY